MRAHCVNLPVKILVNCVNNDVFSRLWTISYMQAQTKVYGEISKQINKDYACGTCSSEAEQPTRRPG